MDRQNLINYLNDVVGVKKIVDLNKYNKFIDAFNDLNNIEKLQKELTELEKELIKRQKGDSYCTDIYLIQYRIDVQKEVIKNLQAIRDKGYKTVEEMLAITEHKNNAYKVYREWINFELTAGDDQNRVRNWHLEKVDSNINLLNNQYNIYHKDKLLEAETEGILQAINELCPEIVYYSGKAKLNDKMVIYEFKEVYYYKLLKLGTESINYRIIKELHTETDHKINGQNKGKFAVDTEYKFILLSV